MNSKDREPSRAFATTMGGCCVCCCLVDLLRYSPTGCCCLRNTLRTSRRECSTRGWHSARVVVVPGKIDRELQVPRGGSCTYGLRCTMRQCDDAIAAGCARARLARRIRRKNSAGIHTRGSARRCCGVEVAFVVHRYGRQLDCCP